MWDWYPKREAAAAPLSRRLVAMVVGGGGRWCRCSTSKLKTRLRRVGIHPFVPKADLLAATWPRTICSARLFGALDIYR